MNDYRCDYCGRFISYADFIEKKAVCIMITPDSDLTREEYETYHNECRRRELLRQGAGLQNR